MQSTQDALSNGVMITRDSKSMSDVQVIRKFIMSTLERFQWYPNFLVNVVKESVMSNYVHMKEAVCLIADL